MRGDQAQRKAAKSPRTATRLRSATCLALMSVSATGLMAEDTAEREVTFQTSDRWQITGSLYVPRSQARVPGVVLVHGSRHESDAYGNLAAPGIPQTLSRRGVATLRIDIRGRGASHEPRAFQALAPAEREAVRLDVEAAISFLASQPGGDARRIGVVAEQDSANAAVLASAKDRRVLASILISGRLSRAAKEAIAASHAPVYCLVSKEDRRGFQDMTDAYLSSKSAHSRLRVFEGLALGTTMFSAWRHEFPHEPPIDELAAVWLAERLSAAVNVSGGRARKR